MSSSQAQLLNTVSKAFRVTENRLRIGEKPLKADNEWIGNGFWVVRRLFEPSFLEKHEPEEVIAVEPILKRAREGNREIILQNDLKMYSDDKIGIKFRGSGGDTWADVYFVSLFQTVQSPERSIRFWQSRQTDPILVKVGKEEVGIISVFRPMSSLG